MFHQTISAGLIQNARRRKPLKLSDYIALWRQRQALRRLDASQLRDIGLETKAVEQEASRSIFDVPQHWMR